MTDKTKLLNLEDLTVEQLHALRQEVRETVMELAHHHKVQSARLVEVEGMLVRKGEVITLKVGQV
ncbi:hypothetical protein [Pantoea phage Nafs113]|nr:hypothetical protein [Pantoea phage Nafs113]